MLDRIREGSKGPVAKIILFLIIITFALTGVSGYLGGGSEDSVAEVNGEKISRIDFDRAYQNERARMEEQLGDFFETLVGDESYMRDFRSGVLERLIEERLATQFAREQGFRPGPNTIRDNIRQMSEFQVAGQFSNDRYNALLMNAGFTPEQFRDYMANELGRSAMLTGLMTSEFMLPHEGELYQQLQNQRRSGEYLRIPVESYTDSVTVSEAEIEAFYYDNEERFETDERIRIEYVVLDFNDILDTVEVSESQARTYYDENPANFRSPERREIAHILIEGNDAEARERIEALLARIEAGEDFAAVAASDSDDTFSGEDGGNLGRLERGMIDPDVEDAGFALDEEGAVSGVVESEFGFHIVQLTRLQRSEVDDFAEVRDDIVENLRRQRAEEEYFAIQQDLSRISFEMPETLEPAAEQTGLELQVSDWMGRRGNEQFDDPRILREVFSSDVARDNLNSELIELDERSYVVRAAEYEAASVRPLDEVRGDIEQALLLRKAREEAQMFAEQLLENYRAGELPAGVSMETFDSITRFNEDVPGEVINQLFRLPAPVDGGVSADITDLRDGDIAIVAVTGIAEGEVNADELAQLAQQFEARYVDAAYQAFMDALKEDASISRNL
ncbi:MAG: SurA N-terminal domain-containing protein [Idiomarina sp.]|nr:SurA N-terminal domain-containing protein [Idiomarina sp.]